ncbi:MAG TPA: AarF/UbiB family protein [Dehalococcoidia bacterium]|nr:AarF/UbiB family protein [Dehalococcoidia bacterium]
MNPLRRASRSARVLYTAAIIYLGYKWTGLRNRRGSEAEQEARLSGQHAGSAKRFLHLATSVKGLMIKSGQVMGARADLFPDEYVEVLSKLHDDVPPRSFEEIRKVVDEELGCPLEEVFVEFDPTPVASASLAQVHRATLKDGREAAVKVQYPDIGEIVKVDLRNIRLMARLAGRLWLRDFDLQSFVNELEFAASQELDFVNEGHNAERIAADFADWEQIVVPGIIWEHSSRRLLVMEYVGGVKTTDRRGLARINVQQEDVLRLLVDAYMEQVLVRGFFHADPHPGNVFVQSGPRLVILDFGLCKELSREFRRDYIGLTFAMVTGNKNVIGNSLRKIGFRTKVDDPSVLEQVGEMFSGRMSDVTTPRRELTQRMNQELMAVLRENPVVEIPTDFLLIGRVMGLIAGLGAQMGVVLDLSDTMTSYALRAQSQLARPALA